MKDQHIKLLDEMILFIRREGELEKLNNAYNYLPYQDVRSSVLSLLGWPVRARIDAKYEDIYSLGSKGHARFNTLFQACPVLLNLFSLHTDGVKWSKELSAEEIEQASVYILKNLKIKKRILRRRKS